MSTRHPYREPEARPAVAQDEAGASDAAVPIALAVVAGLALLRCLAAYATGEPPFGEPALAAVLVVAVGGRVARGRIFRAPSVRRYASSSRESPMTKKAKKASKPAGKTDTKGKRVLDDRDLKQVSGGASNADGHFKRVKVENKG